MHSTEICLIYKAINFEKIHTLPHVLRTYIMKTKKNKKNEYSDHKSQGGKSPKGPQRFSQNNSPITESGTIPLSKATLSGRSQAVVALTELLLAMCSPQDKKHRVIQ